MVGDEHRIQKLFSEALGSWKKQKEALKKNEVEKARTYYNEMLSHLKEIKSLGYPQDVRKFLAETPELPTQFLLKELGLKEQ